MVNEKILIDSIYLQTCMSFYVLLYLQYLPPKLQKASTTFDIGLFSCAILHLILTASSLDLATQWLVLMLVQHRKCNSDLMTTTENSGL